MNSNRTRNIMAILIVAVFMGYLLINWYTTQQASTPTIPLSQVAQEIQDGKIQQIIVVENDLEIHYAGDKQAKAVKEPTTPLSSQLESFGVTSGELEKIKIEIKAGEVARLLLLDLVNLELREDHPAFPVVGVGEGEESCREHVFLADFLSGHGG